jgi:hypothetical protein
MMHQKGNEAIRASKMQPFFNVFRQWMRTCIERRDTYSRPLGVKGGLPTLQSKLVFVNDGPSDPEMPAIRVVTSPDDGKVG